MTTWWIVLGGWQQQHFEWLVGGELKICEDQ